MEFFQSVQLVQKYYLKCGRRSGALFFLESRVVARYAHEVGARTVPSTPSALESQRSTSTSGKLPRYRTCEKLSMLRWVLECRVARRARAAPSDTSRPWRARQRDEASCQPSSRGDPEEPKRSHYSHPYEPATGKAFLLCSPRKRDYLPRVVGLLKYHVDQTIEAIRFAIMFEVKDDGYDDIGALSLNVLG